MVKSTYMWMDGQYDVVEVENKDVVHLGNSKVAASWIQNFFGMKNVAWICGFWDLYSFGFICTVFVFDWVLAVGPSGGHRRAVTAGHR